MTRPWVVLKYGGTSVATAENWGRIARRVQQLSPTHRVWIAASAVSKVSDRLIQATEEALTDRPMESYAWIKARHEELAAEMGLTADEFAPCQELLVELLALLDGIRLVREASPRLRARVLSFGELASTSLGVVMLRKAGLDATRVDARKLLTSDVPTLTPDATRYLEAHVTPRKDRASAEAAADGHAVVLTQGFIASTTEGHTCLLGRGGSDTSGALFAALLEAERCEIWTDVHGMFTTDPRQLPAARLITHLRYREAEEIAGMGAKVLHPRCLGPVAWAGIPLEIRNTRDPDATAITHIGPEADDEPAVLAIARLTGVPLVSVSTLAMWGAPGFLARVFAPFAARGISVDLVATSQSTVTVTLDHVPDGLDGTTFRGLLDDLRELGTVRVVPDCAVVSIVGRHIRTVLHRLGESFAAFENRNVHMVSASSEDLALSFVVDAEDATRLVRELHGRLLGTGKRAPWLGPTWSELTGEGRDEGPALPQRWWVERRAELLGLCQNGQARYVYDLPTVTARATALVTQLPHVQRRYYAMKANAHPDVLRAIVDAGFGIECVSSAEIACVKRVLGEQVPLLFTPNFCPVGEYATAFAAHADVIVDGPDVLLQAPDIFAGRAVGLRIDPGAGLGHHDKVRTAGAHTKFGHPLDDVDSFLAIAAQVGVAVVGLHAHVGSGILDAGAWARTAQTLADLRPKFPDLKWIDLGGGMGVVERPGQDPLDLSAVDTALSTVDGLKGVEVRIEPGRYLVSEAGVLLVPVTQVRTKGDVTFVGGATGMNSLIRPSLYGAWHAIHNLTRLGEKATGVAQVVGPICETGDVLGRDRVLPPTVPGDVLLIENGGAYGAVMSSHYNLRAPADEIALR